MSSPKVEGPRLALTPSAKKRIAEKEERDDGTIEAIVTRCRQTIERKIEKGRAALGAVADGLIAWLDDPQRASRKYDDDVQLAAVASVGIFGGTAQPLPPAWLAASDLTRAIELCIAPPRFSAHGDALERLEKQVDSYEHGYMLRALIEPARALPEGARAAARAALVPRLDSLRPGLQVEIARVLGDVTLLDGYARRAAEDDAFAQDVDATLWGLRLLLNEVGDGDAWEALVVARPRVLQYSGAKTLARSLPRIPPANLARALVAALTKLDDKASRCSPGDFKEAVLLAVCIDDASVAAFIARHAHVKNLTTIVAEYFERLPHLLDALESASREKGKAGDAAKTVLEAVKRKVGGARAAQASPVAAAPAASTSDLPSCLVSPPWRAPAQATKKKTAKKTTEKSAKNASEKEIDLAIPDAPAVHLRPGHHLNWIVRKNGLYEQALTAFASGEKIYWSTENLEGVISHLGAPAIPKALEIAAEHTTRFLELLLNIESPRSAVLVAPFLAKSAEAPRIGAWLVEHARVAATGLVPAALGSDAKVRASARAAIATLVSRGERNAVKQAADACAASKAAHAMIEEAVNEATMLERPKKLPAFAKVDALPAPVLRKGAAPLPPEAMTTLLELLVALPKDRAHPMSAELKTSCTPESLDAFAWTLLSDWVLAGAHSRDDWALFAAGHLGTDAIARKIDAVIPSWVRKSVELMQKALDALSLIGTDVALSLLYERGLAAKFEDTQQRVRQLLERVAEREGIGFEELEDRLVPELGLDAGPIELDYGARKLLVKLDERLVPFVLEDGALSEKPPRPKKTDDAKKAAAAIARFETLKGDLEHAARTQLLRFERAMRDGRAWSAEQWLREIVRHPLLRHVAVRLVFSVDGELVRVCEDGTLADSNDRAFKAAKDARVVVAHPLDAGRASPEAWARMANVFADYEIVQPFPQLSREIFDGAKIDAEASTWEGKTAPWTAVMDLLTGRGWQRTPPEDGTVRTLVLPLDRHGIAGARAELRIAPGLTVGPVKARPAQKLGALSLRGDGATFAALEPRVASEILRDVATLSL
jgi:hypothetical protein